MKSYNLNEKELTYVLYALLNREQWEEVDKTMIAEFDRILKEYRAAVLTGYNKPKNETSI